MPGNGRLIIDATEKREQWPVDTIRGHMCTSVFKEASLSGQVRAVSGSAGITLHYKESAVEDFWTRQGPSSHTRKHLLNFPVILKILLLDMNAFG